MVVSLIAGWSPVDRAIKAATGPGLAELFVVVVAVGLGRNLGLGLAEWPDSQDFPWTVEARHSWM